MQSKPALDILFRRSVAYRGHVIEYGARPEKVSDGDGWRWIPWAECNGVEFSAEIKQADCEALTRSEAIKLSREYSKHLKKIITMTKVKK